VKVSALIAHMGHDKKMKDGAVTFVLARRIGEAFLARDVSTAALDDMLTAALA